MNAPIFEIPGATVLGARASANGHKMVVTKPSQFSGLDWLSKITAGGVLLAAAVALLTGLAISMGITSFHAQFAYVFATKHQRLPSVLEALGLDTGAVIFSLLGIALARLGRRAVIERVLVCACALGSCGMNILSANLGSPRSVAVWALPPVLFALTSDRLVAVVRRSALGRSDDEDAQRSAWRTAGTALLWTARFALAPPSTAKGARQAVLNATPLPAAPAPKAITPGSTGQTQATLDLIRAGTITPEPGSFWALKAAEQNATPATPKPHAHRATSGPTKTRLFLDLVTETYGPLAELDPAKCSKIAAELAPRVGLNTGAARAALRPAVLAAKAAAESAQESE
jgi:hypothetical protein